MRFGTKEDLSDASVSSWTQVAAERDFTCEIRITGLKPATVYHYIVEAAPLTADSVSAGLQGRFETMPPPNADADDASRSSPDRCTRTWTTRRVPHL